MSKALEGEPRCGNCKHWRGDGAFYSCNHEIGRQVTWRWRKERRDYANLFAENAMCELYTPLSGASS